jgi:hypothetical protein
VAQEVEEDRRVEHRMDMNKDPTDNHRHMAGRLLEDTDNDPQFEDILHGTWDPGFRMLVVEELDLYFQSLKEDA